MKTALCLRKLNEQFSDTASSYFLSFPVSSLQKSTCPLISTLPTSQAHLLYFFSFRYRLIPRKSLFTARLELPGVTVPPPFPSPNCLQVIQPLIKAMEEFIQEGLIPGRKRAAGTEEVEDLWGIAGMSAGHEPRAFCLG